MAQEGARGERGERTNECERMSWGEEGEGDGGGREPGEHAKPEAPIPSTRSRPRWTHENGSAPNRPTELGPSMRRATRTVVGKARHEPTFSTQT